MERDLLLIGITIAQLAKSVTGHIKIKEQIMAGVRLAKEIGLDEAIAREAGDEPANEEAIFELASLTTGVAYADVVSKTITSGRTAELSKIEMACQLTTDYSLVTWKVTIGTVVKELVLPTALTLTFPQLSIRGGTVIKVEAKTSSGTPVVWSDITGKEII